MENNTRSAEGALDGYASSHQRLHRQEGAARDAPTSSGHMAIPAQSLGSSSLIAHRQLPCYKRRQIGNDDLLTTIDSHGQSLAECPSLAKSTLAIARCWSPPVVDSMDDKLAKAEARIMGEIMTFVSLQFHPQDSDHLPFELFRIVRPTGEPSTGCGVRGRIC